MTDYCHIGLRGVFRRIQVVCGLAADSENRPMLADILQTCDIIRTAATWACEFSRRPVFWYVTTTLDFLNLVELDEALNR